MAAPLLDLLPLVVPVAGLVLGEGLSSSSASSSSAFGAATEGCADT